MKLYKIQSKEAAGIYCLCGFPICDELYHRRKRMKKKVLIIAREGNAYNVDELVKAHIKALQEVERVLKPGGRSLFQHF